ncbi:MAG: hypothetical protein AB7C89_04425 [Intestinibacillus sp.]
MDTLTLWWQSMSAMQQVFLCIAVPATIILALQTIFLLFGLAGGSGDPAEFDQPDPSMEGADILEDVVPDPDAELFHDAPDHTQSSEHDAAGVRLFTVRGFVAFFAVGGWLGVALLDAAVPVGAAVLLALLGGCAALFAVAYLMKWSLRLQESGALQLREAITRTGTVYIPIPPARSGLGKITLTLQSQLLELDAMTDDGTTLPTGAAVQVVGLFAGNILIVRPLSTPGATRNSHTTT